MTYKEFSNGNDVLAIIGGYEKKCISLLNRHGHSTHDFSFNEKPEFLYRYIGINRKKLSVKVRYIIEALGLFDLTRKFIKENHIETAAVCMSWAMCQAHNADIKIASKHHCFLYDRRNQGRGGVNPPKSTAS